MRNLAMSIVSAVVLAGPVHAQSTPPASGAAQFITVSENALLTSRLVGLSVQSAAGELLGKIEDVALEGGKLSGIILSVGEVLGGDQRYIAVDPASISLRYIENESRWRATMNANADQLRTAPEFRYEGKWKR